MENQIPTADARHASELLATLEADRGAVVPRIATPLWQVLVASLLVVVFVASPLLGGDVATTVQVLFVGFAVLTSGLQRRRLVRPAGTGAVGVLLTVLALGLVLLMLSVSYGLVAGGLGGWVPLPALVAGAGTFLLVRRVDVQGRRRASGVR